MDEAHHGSRRDPIASAIATYLKRVRWAKLKGIQRHLHSEGHLPKDDALLEYLSRENGYRTSNGYYSHESNADAMRRVSRRKGRRQKKAAEPRIHIIPTGMGTGRRS